MNNIYEQLPANLAQRLLINLDKFNITLKSLHYDYANNLAQHINNVEKLLTVINEIKQLELSNLTIEQQEQINNLIIIANENKNV